MIPSSLHLSYIYRRGNLHNLHRDMVGGMVAEEDMDMVGGRVGRGKAEGRAVGRGLVGDMDTARHNRNHHSLFLSL